MGISAFMSFSPAEGRDIKDPSDYKCIAIWNTFYSTAINLSQCSTMDSMFHKTSVASPMIVMFVGT